MDTRLMMESQYPLGHSSLSRLDLHDLRVHELHISMPCWAFVHLVRNTTCTPPSLTRARLNALTGIHSLPTVRCQTGCVCTFTSQCPIGHSSLSLHGTPA